MNMDDHPTWGEESSVTFIDYAGFTAVDVFWLHTGHAIFGGFKE